MSYIPTEQELIDYLYGEADADKRKKIEQYLVEHPDRKEELMGLHETREALGKYHDHEVIAPDILDQHSSQAKANQILPYWRSIAAIAASIALLILIGFATDLRMTYKDAQFVVAFGEVKEENKEIQQQLNSLQQMVAAMANKKAEPLQTDQLKKELIDYLKEQQQSQNQMINNHLAQFTKDGKEALTQYAQEMKMENAAAINQYVANASIDQRAYLEDVLIDFTKYMDEQRLQDRKFYIENLVDMKYKSELKQQETEQLLSSIINKVNNINNESETQNF